MNPRTDHTSAIQAGYRVFLQSAGVDEDRAIQAAQILHRHPLPWTVQQQFAIKQALLQVCRHQMRRANLNIGVQSND